jgi:plastocyanin
MRTIGIVVILLIIVAAGIVAYSAESGSKQTTTTTTSSQATSTPATSTTSASGASSSASSSASATSASTGSSSSSSSSGTAPPGLQGGGPFNTPGNMLITDQFNNRVIELNPTTNKIVWSFGSGNESLCNPGPGAIIGPNDAERLAGGLTLMAGTGIPSGVPAPACADNRVIIVNQAGDIVWQYGQAGVNGSGTNLLNVPVFAIQLPNKDIMIVDQGNNRVIQVNYTTKQIDWSYGPTSGAGKLSNPNAVQMLANGDVLIADQNNNRVIEINYTTMQIVWQYSTGLQTAADATRLPNNDTLIANAGHSTVVEVSPQGKIVWQYNTSLSQGSSKTPYPSNVVRLANGDTSIADTLNNRCLVVNSQNQTVYQYGETNVAGDGPNQLNWPYSCYIIGDYTGQTVPPGVTPSTPGLAQVVIPSGTGANTSATFAPSTITLVVGVNNTITWTNDDVATHTVTSLSVPSGAQSFNSGNLVSGAQFSVTLTVPGTYQYHCSIHSWMKATIIVKAG